MDMPTYHPFRSAVARERFLALYDAQAGEWPVASEARMVHTFYGQTYVRLSGPAAAPPLVLLHDTIGNSLRWMPNIAALSAVYRTYAVDNIYDHGRSVYTRILTGPADFVSWLDGLFTALSLGNDISLMGLAYGGWLACHYALRFPHRLRRLVVLAPAATVLPPSLAWKVRAALGDLPCRPLARGFMAWSLADLARSGDAGRTTVMAWADEGLLARRCFEPRSAVPPAVLADEELRRIGVPALCLVGEHEKSYSGPAAIARLNAVAPQIATQLVPNAGHDLAVVQADLVNRLVLEFLQGTGRNGQDSQDLQDKNRT